MKMGKIYIAGGVTLCLLTAGFGGDAMAATKIASKNYVDSKVNVLSDTIDGLGDTYAGKQATEDALDLKADKTAVETALGLKANKSDFDALKSTVDALDGVDGSITELTESINDKADKLTGVAEAGHVATVDTNGQYQVSDVKLTDVATTSGVASSIATAKSEIEASMANKADTTTVNALGVRVTANEGAIETLNGDAETEGSVAYQIKGKADKVDAAGKGKVAIIANDGNYSASTIAFGDLVTDDNVDTKISNALKNNEGIKEIVAGAADDAIGAALTDEDGAIKSALNAKADTTTVDALDERVTANEGAIETLTGEATVTGSVKNLIAGKADTATVTGLQGDVDTLSGKVTANETAITKLNGNAETEGSVKNLIAGKADKSTVDELSGTVSDNTDAINLNTSSISGMNTKLAGLLNAGTIPAVCTEADATAGCALVYKGSGFTWEVIERADGE